MTPLMSVPAAQGCMVNGMAVRGGGCGGMDVAGMPGCMGLPLFRKHESERGAKDGKQEATLHVSDPHFLQSLHRIGVIL
ncbi:hypothetical protein SXCC_02943 [Gluconacetobacter sp. SXCC-1]|nr:hypothetical protein SXCC_02943 [Gluconacetobacter sp. SXCC-1]